MRLTKEQVENLKEHANAAFRLTKDARTQHDKDYWQGHLDAWEIINRIMFPNTTRKINIITRT